MGPLRLLIGHLRLFLDPTIADSEDGLSLFPLRSMVAQGTVMDHLAPL